MKEKIRKSKKSFTIHQVFSIILIVVLMIYTICLILPILWGVFTSVKSFEDFRVDPVYPPLRHIWQWEWKNFAVIFENFFVRTADFRDVGMLEQIWYTILYAGVGSLTATFVPCIMAYVTARFNFRMSKVIYGIVLFAMILPVVGSFPSELNLMRALNLYDTMIGAWIQKANFFRHILFGVPCLFQESAQRLCRGRVCQRSLRISGDDFDYAAAGAQYFCDGHADQVYRIMERLSKHPAVYAQSAYALLRIILFEQQHAGQSEQRTDAHGGMYDSGDPDHDTFRAFPRPFVQQYFIGRN